MRISDQRQVIVECLKHEALIKDLKEVEKKHDEKRARDLEEDAKARGNKELALIRHEDENKMNMEARTKEVENHQDFLKTSLRII